MSSYLENFLLEICGNCGLSFGSHAAGNLNGWCSAHEGRMDYMFTSRFRSTGEFFDVAPRGARAKNAPCECETYQQHGACHAEKRDVSVLRLGIHIDS